MKKFYLSLMLIFLIKITVYSQPYAYYTTYNDTLPGIFGSSIYQYNFQSKESLLLRDSLYINDYTWDNTGDWLIMDQPRAATLLINYNENISYDGLDPHILSLGALLYSKIYNKFYLFYDYSDQEGLTCLKSFSSSVDDAKELLLLPTSEFIDHLYNKEAFFSSDENTIYFAVDDTNYIGLDPRRFRMNYFSTQTNSIIRNRPLSEIGYPNASSYSLKKGQKGISVIASYHKKPEGNVDSYFRVYNFDKDSGYTFIKSIESSEPYFTNYGKYLILSRTNYDRQKYQEYNKGVIDIFDASSGKLLKTINYPAQGKIYFYDDYPNQLFYFLKDSTGSITSYTINVDEIINPKLKVKLINSSNTNLPGGSLQYYEGGWKNAVDNGDGTFTVDTKLKNVSLRMTYEYGSQTKNNVPVGSDTVTFTTVNALVKLQDSNGNAIDTGKVQYYAGGWRNFGSTINGTASKELLAANYTFRLSYAFASNDKAQNLDTNVTVIFKTINANVELRNNLNNLISDNATIQYYSGGWRNLGSTSNGVASKELLPNNYTFRLSYGFASNDKAQNIGENPTVTFQTVNTNVELRNSLGELIDQGVVQYYSGGWREFGSTANGVISKELLPNNYTFRMSYGFASNDKAQNIGTNPTVIFQTVNTNVELRNSLGELIDQGVVQYYSGGWRNFGSTSSGITSKELLPNNYTFRITHDFISNDKVQNIGTNNTVTFSTVLCSIIARNSQNQPLDNVRASYYSGGWRQIGQTSNGIITKELLSSNLTFRINHGTIQQDKVQNLSTNTNVEFIINSGE
jgi:hypothetical protein